jgi:hypothetical protein
MQLDLLFSLHTLTDIGHPKGHKQNWHDYQATMALDQERNSWMNKHYRILAPLAPPTPLPASALTRIEVVEQSQRTIRLHIVHFCNTYIQQSHNALATNTGILV